MQNTAVGVFIFLSVFVWIQAADVNNTTTALDLDERDAAADRERNLQNYLRANIPGGVITPEMGAFFRYPWIWPPVIPSSTTKVSVMPETTVTSTVPSTASTETTTMASTTVVTEVTTTATIPVTPSTTVTTPVTTVTTVTTPVTTTSTTSVTTETTPATTSTSVTDTTTVLLNTTAKLPGCVPFTGGVNLDGVQLNGTGVPWQSPNGTGVSFSFYGIKYGKAKRFESPSINTDHAYYTTPSRPLAGYQCPQKGSERPMSENCLYLNVFIPVSVKLLGGGNCSSTPVVVFIHGGAYRSASGSKDLYPGTDLANAVDAIVVVPNYRLGVFGFLSTEDKAATGNWGLLDLKLVLKWTSINIKNFGGDPSRVTLIGQSTGAALASFLMFDPDNRDLLHGVLAMSGSSLAPWALARNVRNSTVRLARTLKCSENSSDTMLACLKAKPVADLLSRTTQQDITLAGMTYGPVIDGILIPADPAKLFSNSSWNFSGSFTNGFMAQDASVLLAVDQIWHDKSPGKPYEPLVDWFQQLTFPDTVHDIYGCKSPPTYMMKQVYSFYDLAKSHSWSETRKKLIQIATDLLFVVPAVREAAFYANRKLTSGVLTMYNMSYNDKPVFRSLPATPGAILGAPHGLDLAYLFGYPVADHLLTGLTKAFDAGSIYERDLVRSILHDRSLVSTINHTTDGNSTYLSLETSAGWQTRQKDFTKLLHFWDGIHRYLC